MEEKFDVVVIGSGFGGAVTACRLAQAGRSVCVLERGRQWQKGEFPRSIGQVSKAFWQQGKTQGFLEYKVFKRIDVIQGIGVGGGSLHYFNVTIRTPKAIFEKPEWPAQIKRPVMDPYYELVEDMLDSKQLKPPPGFPGLPRRTLAFLDAAKKAGRNPDLVPIAVFTGNNGDNLNRHSLLPQEPCDYSGDCMLGCRLHAKNSLDLNYLPVAKGNNADIRPLHQVDKIEPLTDGSYKVHFKKYDPNDPAKFEPGHVVGRAVVVSAGTLGTAELLLRCKNVYKTLPNLSPLLGTRFSGNGDFLLAATANADRDIDPSQGPSITAGADFSTANNHIFIEDLGYPNPFMWMLEGTFPSSNRFRDLFVAARSYLFAALGVSSGLTRISFEANDLFSGGATTRLLPYLGMGTDAADGRLQLKNGSIDIDWHPRKSMQMFKELEQGLKELSRGVNGVYRTSILWKWPWRKLLTAHPLGGCFMGDSPEKSVVNEFGQVWGHPNLYVADGSVIPTALSVNPSLTIAALAERIAFWMVNNREMQADDPDRPLNTI